ncbi:hypothetical protein T08_15840 [Trichinella sp. T8]|nr:hypothetical protein T08_15840 [Trichinella sp. T8]
MPLCEDGFSTSFLPVFEISIEFCVIELHRTELRIVRMTCLFFSVHRSRKFIRPLCEKYFSWQISLLNTNEFYWNTFITN